MRLVSPGRKPLLHVVLRQTEADKIIILNVLGGLEVSHSSLSIIEGVLYERKVNSKFTNLWIKKKFRKSDCSDQNPPVNFFSKINGHILTYSS